MAKSKTARKKKTPYKPVDRVEVFIWDIYAGAVALDPKSGFYVFAWDKEFAQRGYELAPLHMPLNEEEEIFVFTGLPIETYKRLPAMLADALPDDFGNALINRYMAEHGINSSQITPLDRLAYMGKRAMGALEFRPNRGPRTQKPSALEMEKLVTTAREVVRGYADTDEHTEAALRSIIEVGTSANGARAKAVISWNPTTDEIRSGQVPAESGFEHWLLKFDGVGEDFELGSSQNYGRIEFAYSLMAKEAKIEIPECRLFEENGRAHFMTRRFDRAGNGTKHHMQSLCAINHIDFKKKSTNSYEQLFMTIRELNLDRENEVEAFRRMVFNVMAMNCDDHSKNFSFLLQRGKKWRLTPAYDITFAYNPKGEWTNQHLMSVNGKYNDIELDDFYEVANRFSIGEAKTIIKEVGNAVKRWPSFAKKARVPADEANRIQKLLKVISTRAEA